MRQLINRKYKTAAHQAWKATLSTGLHGWRNEKRRTRKLPQTLYRVTLSCLRLEDVLRYLGIGNCSSKSPKRAGSIRECRSVQLQRKRKANQRIPRSRLDWTRTQLGIQTWTCLLLAACRMGRKNKKRAALLISHFQQSGKPNHPIISDSGLQHLPA